jgi:hypothetical protein
VVHDQKPATWIAAPGERGWTKIKNRDYWRYELERESAINARRPRMFV